MMVLTLGSDGFIITGDAWQCFVMHGHEWVRASVGEGLPPISVSL